MTTATIARRTPAELKAFNLRTLRPLVAALLAARVFAECERERVDAYTAPIFAEYDFRPAQEWRDTEPDERLTLKNLYLTDLDSPTYHEFNERCYDAAAAHGWTGPRESCPACVAEYAVTKAEWEVLKALCGFMGVDWETANSTMDVRADMLKLAVDMFAKELR
jgi:hypothetical protein